MLDKAHEGLDRHQAGITCARAIVPLGFKVFYLRYAWAHDVTLSFGGRQIVVPGVATVVRAMMTANPRSQVSVLTNEQSMRPTVPKLRGQGLSSMGTLGGIGVSWVEP